MKFGEFFDVDIERIQEQPTVRRIGAAVARAVSEQRVQGIETDTIGSQMACQFDQAFEVSKITDPPVARRADAIELERQQPAADEIAAERPCRLDPQGRLFRE